MTRQFQAAHADARGLLQRWQAPTPQQAAWRGQYLQLCADRGPSALDRAAGPVHLTASCLVMDAHLASVLLVKHRKAQVWVQPGGHVEAGDPSLAAAAAREVREETGVEVDEDRLSLADLHLHGLGHAFGACAEHLDVTFLAVLRGREDVPVAVSAESEDVAWWPVASLPADIVPDLPGRLAGMAPIALRVERCTHVGSRSS